MATNKPRRKKLTELERLPLEILELIFFYALNPNIARASPILGKALSSERIFRRLIVEAFCCADASFQTPGEQKDLQCELLSTKWCTLRRIKSCHAELKALALPHAWKAACTFNTRLIREIEDVRQPTPGSIYPEEGDLEAPEREIEKFFEANDSKIPLLLSFTCPRPGGIGDVFEHPILMIRTVPESLIRASVYSQDHLELLKYIRPGWRRIRPCDAFQIEPSSLSVRQGQKTNPRSTENILVDVIKEAVERGNVAALRVFVELYSSCGLEICLPFVNKICDHDRIPENFFELATRQKDAMEMLKVLIRLGWRDLPKDSSALTAWAVRTRDREPGHGGFAKWLLTYMEKKSAENHNKLFFDYGYGFHGYIWPQELNNTPFFDQEAYGFSISMNPVEAPLRWFWPCMALEFIDDIFYGHVEDTVPESSQSSSQR